MNWITMRLRRLACRIFGHAKPKWRMMTERYAGRWCPRCYRMDDGTHFPPGSWDANWNFKETNECSSGQ